MDLQQITACVMVRNESYFIQHVLSPLVGRFGQVLVFDTGSEDGTADMAEAMGAKVVRKGVCSTEQIGSCRNEMQQMAQTPWTMIVDGDELYPKGLIDDIERYFVPVGKVLGFTPMISVDFVDGRYVLMDDKFSRVALHPSSAIYKGEYPFESPNLFNDPANFFYIDSVHQAYHLHRLVRSPFDDRVHLRVDKRPLYSLQKVERPVLGPVDLPLNPSYPDPYANATL